MSEDKLIILECQKVTFLKKKLILQTIVTCFSHSTTYEHIAYFPLSALVDRSPKGREGRSYPALGPLGGKIAA